MADAVLAEADRRMYRSRQEHKGAQLEPRAAAGTGVRGVVRAGQLGRLKPALRGGEDVEAGFEAFGAAKSRPHDAGAAAAELSLEFHRFAGFQHAALMADAKPR